MLEWRWWALCPVSSPGAPGDTTARRLWGEQVPAYPTTDPASPGCVPEVTGLCPGRNLRAGMSECDPLSCVRWDSPPSKPIFGWSGLPVKRHSAALLHLKMGAVWGSGFNHRHLCVTPFYLYLLHWLERKTLTMGGLIPFVVIKIEISLDLSDKIKELWLTSLLDLLSEATFSGLKP